MPDFTSALYLGLNHASSTLPGWQQLTGGRPALLEEPEGGDAVAASLSRLLGVEQAVLMPSTLHLFLDVFERTAQPNTAVFIDGGCYPIARWGAESVAMRGIQVVFFARQDPRDLMRQLARICRHGLRPLVLADGICPASGQVAPLGDYLEAVRHFGGLLVVDDTQALGLLGQRPDRHMPYGYGGGGSLRHLGLQGPDILIGASLAKAFGVPVAVLGGSARQIQSFKNQSLTRLHCSPPSVAVIQGAQRALAINRYVGDSLRARLLAQVQRFRQGLGQLGLAVEGGFFPLQSLEQQDPGWHRTLLERGVKSLLLKPRTGSAFRLGFVINAAHRVEDIDECLAQLEGLLFGRRSVGRKLANLVRSLGR